MDFSFHTSVDFIVNFITNPIVVSFFTIFILFSYWHMTFCTAKILYRKQWWPASMQTIARWVLSYYYGTRICEGATLVKATSVNRWIHGTCSNSRIKHYLSDFPDEIETSSACFVPDGVSFLEIWSITQRTSCTAVQARDDKLSGVNALIHHDNATTTVYKPANPPF